MTNPIHLGNLSQVSQANGLQANTAHLQQKLIAKKMLAALVAKGRDQAAESTSIAKPVSTAQAINANDVEVIGHQVLAQQQAGVASSLFGYTLNRKQIVDLFRRLIVDDENVLQYTLSKVVKGDDFNSRDESDGYRDESESQRNLRYFLTEQYALQQHQEGALQLTGQQINQLNVSIQGRLLADPITLQAQITAAFEAERMGDKLKLSPRNFATIYSELLVESNRLGGLAEKVIRMGPQDIAANIHVLMKSLQNAFLRDIKLSRRVFENRDLSNQFLKQIRLLEDLGKLNINTRATKAMLKSKGADRLPEDAHELAAHCRLIDNDDSVSSTPLKDFARSIPNQKFRAVYLSQSVNHLRQIPGDRWKEPLLRLQVIGELMYTAHQSYLGVNF